MSKQRQLENLYFEVKRKLEKQFSGKRYHRYPGSGKRVRKGGMV